MSSKTIIGLFIIIFVLVILYLVIFWRDQFLTWLNAQWLDLVFAVILAIIVGLVLNYMYKKSSKSKMLKTTMTPPNNTHHSMAKLVLKENQEFIIKEFMRVFGREDFIGVTGPDDLLYIGKEHFKITKQSDGYYIKDLNTKNGTQVNGKEIKGKGKWKLENEDNIVIAQILNIKYFDK
jgi:FHA domain